ncbi:MAG TPA: hypothetical protein VLR26_17545 [Frankiaceae bacterium]|nr:hypothetical protein [Frankiaceae bacterium]
MPDQVLSPTAILRRLPADVRSFGHAVRTAPPPPASPVPPHPGQVRLPGGLFVDRFGAVGAGNALVVAVISTVAARRLTGPARRPVVLLAWASGIPAAAAVLGAVAISTVNRAVRGYSAESGTPTPSG